MDLTSIVILIGFVGLVVLGCAGFLFNKNTLKEISSESRTEDEQAR